MILNVVFKMSVMIVYFIIVIFIMKINGLEFDVISSVAGTIGTALCCYISSRVGE